jgi:hypothetical protein
MRLANIIGAISASTLVVTLDRADSLSYPFKGQSPAPNDAGPVVDTTPESKRAKRRRLTREFKRAKRLPSPTK